MTTTTKRTRPAAAAVAPVKRVRPAKRATPPPAVEPSDGPASPPPDTDTTPVAPTDTVLFQGRKMAVIRPTPEQLGMWKVTGDELARAQANMPGNRASVLLARAIRLITSVLAHDDDKDWLHDQLLDGSLSLEQAADILSLAAKAFVAGGTKAPTTGPTPKARRGR
jgi:hypothetical protein